MVIGLWYTLIPNLVSLSWFQRCKEHTCPLSPYLKLWRMIEVPSWGAAFYLDLDMVTGLWYIHDPNYCSLYWFWRCKEDLCPLSHHLGLLKTLEVIDWGCASWSWFGYGQEPCLDDPWNFLVGSALDLLMPMCVCIRPCLIGFDQLSLSWVMTVFSLGPTPTRPDPGNDNSKLIWL